MNLECKHQWAFGIQQAGIQVLHILDCELVHILFAMSVSGTYLWYLMVKVSLHHGCSEIRHGSEFKTTGFTADGSVENFKRRRQTELKHGRISMLATMGYITPETWIALNVFFVYIYTNSHTVYMFKFILAFSYSYVDGMYHIVRVSMFLFSHMYVYVYIYKLHECK